MPARRSPSRGVRSLPFARGPAAPRPEPELVRRVAGRGLLQARPPVRAEGGGGKGGAEHKTCKVFFFLLHLIKKKIFFFFCKPEGSRPERARVRGSRAAARGGGRGLAEAARRPPCDQAVR